MVIWDHLLGGVQWGQDAIPRYQPRVPGQDPRGRGEAGETCQRRLPSLCVSLNERKALFPLPSHLKLELFHVCILGRPHPLH